MSYKYKFSVIMAVYKVEEYIRESIDSLINQTIGFENIQLILVDDGSPDNSGAICDEYAAKYSNIVVAHKENGGVSSARNRGLELIEGEYVNFLDPDDLLTPKTLSKVYKFFKKHSDEVDIVSIPLVFFEGRKGDHVLNFKYKKGTRVVDLNEDWFNPQLSLSSSFIKNEVIRDERFDSRLIFAEDAQLVQHCLFHKQKLGLVADGKYMYRSRISSGSSALQTAGMKPEWFLPCMEHFHIHTINYYKERMGYVPKFIQATLMYDMQWRLKRTIPDGILTDEERAKYFKYVETVVKYFDDDVIAIQRQATSEIKVFAYMIKYNQGTEIVPDGEGGLALAHRGEVLYDLSNCSSNLQFININENEILIDGFVNMFTLPFENFDMKLSHNGKLYECEPGEIIEVGALETVILKRYRFKCKLPLCKKNKISVVVNINGTDVLLNNITLGKFFPISDVYKTAYFYTEKKVLTKKKDSIYVKKCSTVKRFFKELILLLEMWLRNRNGGRNAVMARVAVKFLKFKWRKPIWLISDRASKAGDNGEAFFRYMTENHPEIDTYFVISNDCDDYAKMQKIGNVVEKECFKHKLLLLMSDYIISSHAEEYIFNPFYSYNHGYRDILSQKKFIFLQHGVTKDDLSDWLNRYNKNIYGFVTAAKPEYNSVLEYNYHYNEDRVWLTGFARFDRLFCDEKKQITIMPTWRRYIMDSLDKETGIWSITDEFADSDFVKFYRDLINDQRLNEAMAKYGYKLSFMPHPNIQPYLGYFEGNENVEFLGAETDYRDIYAYSNLLITDYSSAVFDFAYLKKPVLYCHFDADVFFGGEHTYEKGYFDYERDGFGEVEYSVEDTVNRIIEYMENDCKMKDKYLDRVNNFFAFTDKNNCQRIYEKIKELESK